MAIKNHHYNDEITFDCFQKDCKGYSWETFRQDALAGLSVAMLTVPQAMAYALVAGLPLSCGLFAAIFSSLIAASFGSSRHMVCGPGNAIGLIIQSVTAEILFTYYRDVSGPERDMLALQILTQLTMLVGVFQIAGAVLKLGRLSQFVSHSVIVGYIVGASLAVFVGQLTTLLGIDINRGNMSVYEQIIYVFTHLDFIHWPTALVGIGCLMILVIFRRLDKRLPAPVIMLAIVGTVVTLVGIVFQEPIVTTDLSSIHKVSLVGDAGELGFILPAISLPYFDPGIMNKLLPVAFAISLLCVMETVSVSKSIAATSGQRISLNQEILGLGLANLVSAFIVALPISGSLSRSHLIYTNGGKTRFAAILNCLFVIVILLGFGFLVSKIPMTALSALLILNAVTVINARQFAMCFKSTPADALVLGATTVSSLFFTFDIAFYIGIVISVTLYLKKAAIPHLVEFAVDDTGMLHNLEGEDPEARKPIRVIKVEGELFFGSADLFQSTLKSIAEDDTTTKVIILQLKNARDIDATTCLAIQQLNEYLTQSGRYLIGCGLTEGIWEVLKDSGIVDLIGKENLFSFDEHHPQLSAQKALYRARELIALSNVKNVDLLGETSETMELVPIKEKT